MACPERWTVQGCFHGFVYVCVDTIAAVADAIPGYSAETTYQQFFGLAADPDRPAAPEKSRVAPARVAAVFARFLRAMWRYPGWARGHRAIAGQRLAEAVGLDWSVVPDAELVRILQASAAEWPELRLPLLMGASVAGSGAEWVARLTARHAGDHDGALARQLLSGIGGIELADSHRFLAEVAAGRRRLEDAIDLLGFRGPNEYELAAPMWRDDPQALARMVAASSVRSHSTSATSIAEARKRARMEARQRAGLLHGLLIAAAVRWLEPHLRWRENAKVHEAMHAARQRIVAREAGRRLRARGAIEEAQEVFFLRADELYAALLGNGARDLRRNVVRRRRDHERAMSLEMPDLVLAGPQGLSPVPAERLRRLGLLPVAQDEEAPEDGVYAGLGVSPGVATGPTRVVSDSFGAELADGEVLVAHTTDPGWTPLFAQAAAVVVEHGGQLSHAAIVARELGVPCVVNVPHACERIATGTRVCVDGGTGVVRVI